MGSTVSQEREDQIRRTWTHLTGGASARKWAWSSGSVLTIPTVLQLDRLDFQKCTNLAETVMLNNDCHFVRSQRHASFVAAAVAEIDRGIETMIECEGVIVEHVFESYDGKVFVNLLNKPRY